MMIAHVGAIGGEDQLARGLGIFARRDARPAQQRHRLVEDAALGQRDGDAVHGVGHWPKETILPEA